MVKGCNHGTLLFTPKWLVYGSSEHWMLGKVRGMCERKLGWEENAEQSGSALAQQGLVKWSRTEGAAWWTQQGLTSATARIADGMCLNIETQPKQTQTSRRSRSLVGRFVFVFLRMKARSSLKTCFLCLPRSGGSTVFSFWERDAYCFYKTNIWGSGGVRPAVGSKTEQLFRILSQKARFSWDKNNSIVVLLDALGNIYRQCWT